MMTVFHKYIVIDLKNCNFAIENDIFDKRDDFDFEIVDFPFLDGDVPRSTSYGVYILNFTDDTMIWYLK